MFARHEVQVPDAGFGVLGQLTFLLRREALPELLEIHDHALYRTDKVRASMAFSRPLMYRTGKARQTSRAMTDIYEIRRENLREQARKVGGQAKLAARLDKSESEISQLIGRTPQRNIGGRRARTFERFLGLKPGALDLPPDTGEFQQSEIMREIGRLLSTKDRETQQDVLELIRRIK